MDAACVVSVLQQVDFGFDCTFWLLCVSEHRFLCGGPPPSALLAVYPALELLGQRVSQRLPV